MNSESIKKHDNIDKNDEDSLLQNQPKEIISEIIQHLDPISFSKFRLVCSNFNNISYNFINTMKNEYYNQKYKKIEVQKHKSYLEYKKKIRKISSHQRRILKFDTDSVINFSLDDITDREIEESNYDYIIDHDIEESNNDD
jgi:hypothetical protein